MAKYNNKMQFLNSSARVAHNTAEEGPHTWIQKILRKVAKHLRHNKSFVADQYSDAAANGNTGMAGAYLTKKKKISQPLAHGSIGKRHATVAWLW